MNKTASILIIIGVAIALILGGGVMKVIGTSQLESDISLDGTWYYTGESGDVSSITFSNGEGVWKIPGSDLSIGAENDAMHKIISGTYKFTYEKSYLNYYLLKTVEFDTEYVSGENNTISVSQVYIIKPGKDKIDMYDVSYNFVSSFTRAV